MRWGFQPKGVEQLILTGTHDGLWVLCATHRKRCPYTRGERCECNPKLPIVAHIKDPDFRDR